MKWLGYFPTISSKCKTSIVQNAPHCMLFPSLLYMYNQGLIETPKPWSLLNCTLYIGTPDLIVMWHCKGMFFSLLNELDVTFQFGEIVNCTYSGTFDNCDIKVLAKFNWTNPPKLFLPTLFSHSSSSLSLKMTVLQCQNIKIFIYCVLDNSASLLSSMAQLQQAQVLIQPIYSGYFQLKIYHGLK